MKKSEVLALLQAVSKGEKKIEDAQAELAANQGGKHRHASEIPTPKDLTEGIYWIEGGKCHKYPLTYLTCEAQIYYKGLKAAKEKAEKEKAIQTQATVQPLKKAVGGRR